MRNWSVVRRSSRSSSARSWSSQYANSIESTDVCVSFRSMTLPRSRGPNELIVARTGAPSAPVSDSGSTGWAVGVNAQSSDSARSRILASLRRRAPRGR
ncbi:MAG TPA: hypothetical protein VFT80_00500 [Actinomycetota bacterium]|nr:hypothetical protein [Actinomycetota bacterium]